MAKKDKFGSPYDPKNNGGKAFDPKAGPEDNYERLFGLEFMRPPTLKCQNPECQDCYPSTRPSFYKEAMREAMKDTVSRMGRGNFLFEISPPDEEDRSGPPKAYREARAAVAQWIMDAPDVSFDDIVGNDEALMQLRDAIEAPVKQKELYEAYGMKMPKGALLCGPPGSGKTMFAKAAAATIKKMYGKTSEFLALSGSKLQAMYVGETEKRITAIFTFAREYKKYHGYPLLVFIDEAEVILPDRTGRIRKVHSFEESQVAAFIAEMDGMQESGAFILLATNRPEVIDQALLRDGRCDFKITVKRPNRDAIEVILQRAFQGILCKEDTEEMLVMAAFESLHDPHRVIMEAHAIGVDFAKEELKEVHNKHFLLEHIVSGAMAVSIPARAKRFAFARDKLTGKVSGVTVSDVVKAVDALFEENKRLDHSYALAEFREEFMAEAKAMTEKPIDKRNMQ